jgi:magnesium transporter
MDLEHSLAYAALEAHPHDAARVLEDLPRNATVAMLERATPALAAEVLRFGAPHFALAVLEALPVVEAGRILERTPVEVAAGLLGRFPETEREAFLGELPASRARTIRSLLRYPPGCAASLMDPRALALPEDVKVDEALRRIHREPEGALFELYVLDRDDVLRGVSSLPEVIAARPKDALATVMSAPVPSAPARASRVAVLEHPGWRTLSSLPVIDERGVFLGAIRYPAIRQIETEFRTGERDPRVQTARAIGDVFSAAVGGVVEALAAGLSAQRPSRGGKPEP